MGQTYDLPQERSNMAYNKYGNIKTIIDGIKFDSKAEAERYCELKLLEKAGVIKNLKLQPRFILQHSFKHEGKTVRAITYVADFQYTENGKEIVEDVKGVETAVFKIKKKMFIKIYDGIYEFRIVK